jgi:TolA-binding protein
MAVTGRRFFADTTMKLQITLFGVLALTSGEALLAQARIQDMLVTTGGRRIRGIEITEMSASTIKYARGGETLDFPAISVAEVVWSDPPQAFLLGRSAARTGKFQDAANAFKEAADATKREVLKAEALYLEADALLRAAGSDQQKASFAADKLTVWINTYPTGYRLPDASLALGRATLAAGKPEQAELTFKKLASDALANNWGAVWSARAKFEEARALLAKGDLGNARSSFRQAQQSAQQAGGDAPSPELLTLMAEASVGVGETMVREGQFDEALRYFRDLNNRAPNAAVRAAAKAGEGEALYLRAKDSGDADALRAAQVALAEANLLDPTAGEVTAKALYYSGMVLLALGPDHESSTFRQRALDYFASVTRDYSSTSWASRAAEAARN